jgi:hypothetical protein
MYCLFVKGVILNGRVGVYYALQRTFAEFMLSLYLFENDLSKGRARRDVEQSQDKPVEINS